MIVLWRGKEHLKKLKSEHGFQLGNITVDMVLGGMRGMIGMLWETSLLDPDEGSLNSIVPEGIANCC